MRFLQTVTLITSMLWMSTVHPALASGRRPPSHQPQSQDTAHHHESAAGAWTTLFHALSLTYELPGEKRSPIHWGEVVHHSIEAAEHFMALGGSVSPFLATTRGIASLSNTLIKGIFMDRKRMNSWTDFSFHLAQGLSELPALFRTNSGRLTQMATQAALWVPVLSFAHSLAHLVTLSENFESPAFFTELLHHWVILGEGKSELEQAIGREIDGGLVTFLFSVATMIGIANRKKTRDLDTAKDAQTDPKSSPSAVILEHLSTLERLDSGRPILESHRSAILPAMDRYFDRRVVKAGNQLLSTIQLLGRPDHSFAVSNQTPDQNYRPFLRVNGRTNSKGVSGLKAQDQWQAEALQNTAASRETLRLRDAAAVSKDIQWVR